LQSVDIQAPSIDRIHSIKLVAAKFKKEYKLERDSNTGWYSFLGKNYKEVSDIPDEKAFEQAYTNMPEVEKGLYRTYKIKLPEGLTVDEAIAKLKDNPDVEYVQPNQKMVPYMTPNDPYYLSRGSWGQAFDDLYARYIHKRVNFQDLTYETKKLIMHTSMPSEMNVLGHQLNRISEKSRLSRDFH